jgi:hypothetical protein
VLGRGATRAAPNAVGVDVDGEGGLWLAFRSPTSDYYEYADVRVAHVDAAGGVIAEFHYADEFTKVSGLAFTGDAVWLNYNDGGGSGNNRIRKLDPVTGAEIGSFATEAGITDVSARDGVLLLSNLWNQLVAIDRGRGGEVWRAHIDAFEEGGTQRGIAAAGDGQLTYVLSQATDRLYLIDDSGDEVGSGGLPGFDSAFEPETDQLALDGDRLIVLHRGEIVWYEVLR